MNENGPTFALNALRSLRCRQNRARRRLPCPRRLTRQALLEEGVVDPFVVLEKTPRHDHPNCVPAWRPAETDRSGYIGNGAEGHSADRLPRGRNPESSISERLAAALTGGAVNTIPDWYEKGDDFRVKRTAASVERIH
jgi:hypothetical protein